MAGVISKFSGQYAWLSNFSEGKVTMRLSRGSQVEFPTAEHAFQSMKVHALTSGDPEAYVNSVKAAQTPAKAKYAGKVCKIDVPKWDSIKDDCMRAVVFAKFTESDTLRTKLLDTGASLLVEGNEHGDTYWGRCEGRGRNILGSILMEVRGYFYFVTKIGQPTMPQELQARLTMSWN